MVKCHIRFVGLNYGDTLLNWKSTFEWYIGELLVKNGHQKNTCYDEIGFCAKYMVTSMTSTVNKIQERPTWSQPQNRECQSWPSIIFAYKLWFWSSKWQSTQFRLLIGWDDSQSDPTINIVYGVGSAHNRSIYFTYSNYEKLERPKYLWDLEWRDNPKIQFNTSEWP